MEKPICTHQCVPAALSQLSCSEFVPFPPSEARRFLHRSPERKCLMLAILIRFTHWGRHVGNAAELFSVFAFLESASRWGSSPEQLVKKIRAGGFREKGLFFFQKLVHCRHAMKGLWSGKWLQSRGCWTRRHKAWVWSPASLLTKWVTLA